MTPAQRLDAATILAKARRAGSTIQDLPAELTPATLLDAYPLQAQVVRLLGSVGGWKVMLPKDGSEPRGTAIPRPYVVGSGAQWPARAPVRLEVEVALKIGRDVPKRAAPYREADMPDLVESAHIALELLGHRFVDRKQVSALSYLADGQGNAGVVVGAELAAWNHIPLQSLPMTLESAGTMIATADTGPSLDETLRGLAWLANHALEWGEGLKAGHIVMTGARIGGTSVPVNQPIVARAASGARVSVTIGV
jgi:2-keto-4-pentenoate hydratase